MVFLSAVAFGLPAESYAQDMTTDGHSFWFWGKVRDNNGSPISGVTVRCVDCIPVKQTTTNSSGDYVIEYHNFCGNKFLDAFGEGWEEVRKSVWDDSCPDCCEPGDQFCQDNAICDWDDKTDFTLNPDGNQDIDNDGLANAFDNCPNKPNWISLGTCTEGKRGNLCTSNGQCDKCGTKGFCSRFQEDCDGNGIGDACDVCVTQPDGCGNCNFKVASEQNPLHKFMAESDEVLITQMTDEDVQTMWYVILNLWWSAHNAQSYPTLLQGFATFINGPDYLCGEPVHDFNENGIADEEEEGGLPLRYSLNFRLMLQALIDAYNYCITVKLPNCDPEEDPFGCKW
jgi:hypothetical protein